MNVMETLIQELRQTYQNKSKSIQKQEQIQLLKQHDSLLFQVTKAKIQKLMDSYESLFLKSSTSISGRRKDEVENSKRHSKKPRPPLPPPTAAPIGYSNPPSYQQAQYQPSTGAAVGYSYPQQSATSSSSTTSYSYGNNNSSQSGYSSSYYQAAAPPIPPSSSATSSSYSSYPAPPVPPPPSSYYQPPPSYPVPPPLPPAAGRPSYSYPGEDSYNKRGRERYPEDSLESHKKPKY
jgi:hypothetical protein